MQFESHSCRVEPSGALARQAPDKRVREAGLMRLLELDPRRVIKTAALASGALQDSVTPVATMRETCPHCPGVPLQLVLRYQQVLQSHLFCPTCHRRYDAIRPDGRSALAYSGFSAD